MEKGGKERERERDTHHTNPSLLLAPLYMKLLTYLKKISSIPGLSFVSNLLCFSSLWSHTILFHHWQ